MPNYDIFAKLLQLDVCKPTRLPPYLLLTDYVTTGNRQKNGVHRRCSIANFNFNLTAIRCSSKIFFHASRQYFAENKCVNSVPSFEGSSIFMPVKIDDIFQMENPNQYAV